MVFIIWRRHYMKTYFRNVMNTLERSVESMDVGIFEQLVSECKRVIESGC